MTQEYCTNHLLSSLLERYSSSRRPISVNFRKLVSWVPSGERATHYIHPYPAKLLAHIPHFFLNNNLLSKPGDTVLDPFCGSGTVLLEALLAGRRPTGFDTNPLACLVSRVKSSNHDATLLDEHLRCLVKVIPRTPKGELPAVVNLQYWFHPHVVDDLCKIKSAIASIENESFREFFLVCFSVCVRKVSCADPRLSVPVRLKSTKYPEGHWLEEKTRQRIHELKTVNTLSVFKEICIQNINRMRTLNAALDNQENAHVSNNDARAVTDHLTPSSIQLVITSPPYVGAQKYIRASSLSLGWLGFTKSMSLRQLEDQNIGREHYRKSNYAKLAITGIGRADCNLKKVWNKNPLRAHIAANYLNEAKDAFKGTIDVIRPGGYLVLIAANNYVCGQEFKTQEYLRCIIEELGMKLQLRLIDDIRSRGLMTRRNKTASVITREWALLFQKTNT